MSVRVNLCEEHLKVNLQCFFPGYCFNLVVYIGNLLCEYLNCQNKAFRTAIGVRVPETAKDFNEDNAARASINAPFLSEIYGEARNLLEGGIARERLAAYLRTRVMPQRKREGYRLCKIFASLILKELGIKNNELLTPVKIEMILDYLEVYPFDHRRSFA